MATPQLFSNMLNQFLPETLLEQELIKRCYLLQRCEKNKSWKGGPLIIPFEQQYASSVEFGQLADVSDISSYAYTRGQISVQPEAWASFQVLHKDLVNNEGKIPESTFLKILPNQADKMIEYFKMVLSVHLMGKTGAFAKLVAAAGSSTGSTGGTTMGVFVTDRIDRFTLSQKMVLNDNGTAGQKTVYVIGIDVNACQVTVSATRGGAAVDISAYTIANGTRCFHPGSVTMGMTPILAQLLPASQGGSSTIFGVNKLAAPYTQCPFVDGSAYTASNLLQGIFDAYTQRMILGKSGNLPEVMISFKNFGAVLKQLQGLTGAFNVVPQSRKISAYGWQEVTVGSVSGAVLKLVAIQEQPDDYISFIDWSGVTFYSNGDLIRRRKSPDGLEYFEQRSTAGYVFTMDHFVQGDLVVDAPWKQLVLGNIAI